MVCRCGNASNCLSFKNLVRPGQLPMKSFVQNTGSDESGSHIVSRSMVLGRYRDGCSLAVKTYGPIQSFLTFLRLRRRRRSRTWLSGVLSLYRTRSSSVSEELRPLEGASSRYTRKFVSSYTRTRSSRVNCFGIHNQSLCSALSKIVTSCRRRQVRFGVLIHSDVPVSENFLRVSERRLGRMRLANRRWYALP